MRWATGVVVALTRLVFAGGVAVGSSALAADGGSTHIVAADGSGDFVTIQAAVDAAERGDSVMVRPGTYTEAITIDKDLVVAGDRSGDGVVVSASPDPDSMGSRADIGRPYAFRLTADSVTLADLTVLTPDGTNGIVATAGAPRIERVSLAGPEEVGVRTTAHSHRAFTSLAFFGETSPTIKDCEWDGYVAVRDGASATFIGNTVLGDTISIDGPGESSVLDSVLVRGSISFSLGATGFAEGNTFTGDLGQIGVDTGSVVEVRGNTFTGSADDASIWVEGPEVSAVIDGNTVADSVSALRLARGGAVTVKDNEFEAGTMGISVAGTDAHIEGNRISSAGAGIVVVSAAAPTIVDNTIEADLRAIVVGPRSTATVSGNEICGGEAGIHDESGTDVDAGDNVICGEPAS